MGNQMRYLSKPVTDCHFEHGAGKTYSYTAASMQGWRKYQEDRVICIPDFYEDCSFFGVYDGHGGSEIAEFLRQRLHLEILNSLQTQNDIELALHLGFLSCDASIMEPENIAELNDMVEEENRGSAAQILKNQRALEAAMSQTGEDQSRIAGTSATSAPTCAASATTCAASATTCAASATTCAASATTSTTPTSAGSLFNAGSSAGIIFQCLIQSDLGPTEESIYADLRSCQENMEVENPIDYLLSDDIESSDPEDEDYNIEEDVESSSSESEEDTNCISTEEFLTSEPGYLSGSTATVAILKKNKIYVANIGDSRCVLSRKGQAIDMSLDHKPDDPEEHARIIGAGGSVSEDGRVDNCLNLSRAFGDFKFKGDSFVPSQQCITAEPFIKSVDIEKDDDFLIIASDGIWNSMSSQEVVDYINIRLQAGDCDLKDICEEMFKFTLAPDKDNDGTGCDNMSCIIIKFGSKGDSSFIHQVGVSNKAMSSGDFSKQEEMDINAPTSGNTDQMTSNMSEKTSPVDEKNNQNAHLISQCPTLSMQLLVKLEVAISDTKNKIQEKSSKVAHLRDLDFANRCVEQNAHHFKNTQFKDVSPGFQIISTVNSADNVCKICLSHSLEKQSLYHMCTSNVFNNAAQIIPVKC